MFNFLADMVLFVHLAFIVFVLFGGLLLLRWPRLVWLHIPAIIWGIFIEVSAGECPLTPLESYFRTIAGHGIYYGDFVGQYLLPLVYPAVLTPAIQLILAGIVVISNCIVYSVVVRMHGKAHKSDRHSAR